MTDIEIQSKPAPRIVVRKRFQCVFCSFSRATKQLVVDHIARCWSDPAAKTCRTCIFHVRAYRGAVDPCIPGQPCDCDSEKEHCALGVPLPERAPVVDCASWRDRDEEEDEPAEDPWDRDARALNGGDAA